MSSLMLELIDFEVNGIKIKTTPLQLVQWKHGMLLEMKGLKLSRGRTVSGYLRKAFKLKRNHPIENLIELVSARFDEVKARAA